MKFDFCETCPDKYGEACPLPSATEKGIAFAKRAGWKTLQYVDAAITGEVEHPTVNPHEDRWPHKQSIAAAQRKVYLDQHIADCVTEHQVVPEPVIEAGNEPITPIYLLRPEA
jgi:hypothetical protein